MYLCYMDESGTSAIPGNTSHFILAGLSIPIWHWKDCDYEVNQIKKHYSLEHAEIHTGWIIRKYLEQSKITDFEKLNHSQRRYEVDKLRKTELLRLQKSGNSKLYKQTRKNYRRTQDYIHLTLAERHEFISKIAHCVSNWGFARLFAECIDKVYFDPSRGSSIDKQAFEQVISRFEQYLQVLGKGNKSKQTVFGLIIHDNNETVARKHTSLMKDFHRNGTLWTKIKHIIETPLFVDSELTSLVQIIDLCSYAIRRYLENNESDLFDLVFKRADRKNDVVVGIRHFSEPSCNCKICKAHNVK